MSREGYKIAILEFDKHWDCVDGFSRILSGSAHQLTVLCDDYIHRCLSPYPHNASVRFSILREKETIAAFLERNHALLAESDFILIDTIHTNPKAFLSIPFEKLTVLRVHNAFKQFSPWSHLKVPLGLMYIRKAISYFLLEMLAHRSFYYFKRINTKVHYFTFLSQSITTYVLSNHLMEAGKVMFPIPLLPFDETSSPKPEDKIVISIVGTVEKRKKDFTPIIEAFTRIFSRQEKYAVRVELHLLGSSAGAYGKKITTALKQLESGSFTFYFYEKNVPVDIFDETLNRSHLIISPLRVKNITQVFQEIYGKTKFTASIGVIIKHKLIGIFPSDFVFDEAFEPHLRKYKDGVALSNLLLGYIHDPSGLAISREKLIRFLAEAYDKKKILHQLEVFIEQNRF